MNTVQSHGVAGISHQKVDFLADPDECELDLDLMGALATRGELQSIVNRLPEDSDTRSYVVGFMAQRGNFPGQQAEIPHAA